MNRLFYLLMLPCLAVTQSVYGYSEDKKVPIEERYFGEQPPSLTPKVFAPKMLYKNRAVFGGIFS